MENLACQQTPVTSVETNGLNGMEVDGAVPSSPPHKVRVKKPIGFRGHRAASVAEMGADADGAIDDDDSVHKKRDRRGRPKGSTLQARADIAVMLRDNQSKCLPALWAARVTQYSQSIQELESRVPVIQSERTSVEKFIADCESYHKQYPSVPWDSDNLAICTVQGPKLIAEKIETLQRVREAQLRLRDERDALVGWWPTAGEHTHAELSSLVTGLGNNDLAAVDALLQILPTPSIDATGTLAEQVQIMKQQAHARFGDDATRIKAAFAKMLDMLTAAAIDR